MRKTPLLALPVWLLVPTVVLAQSAAVAQPAGAPAGAAVSTAAGSTAPSATVSGTNGVTTGSAPAPTMVGVDGTAPTDPVAEWADRDRAINESVNGDGSVGLLHLKHAQGGAPGQLRIQFMTEYFTGGWLCNSAYPCRNPANGTAITSDSHDHIGGQLALGVTLTKWLEISASTSAYANANTANRPGLIQVLGDSSLGLKAFGGLSKAFFLGGAIDMWLLNGTGSVGLSEANFKFTGVATLDLRGTPSKTPLRFSLNGGYVVDQSGSLVNDVESRRGTPITRIERAGLRINRTDHVDLKLGGEVFLAEERVRPFIEYGIDIPVNRQNYLCRANNPSSDGCLANDAIAPSRLTIGARFVPWRRGFSLTAAFDIGVTGSSSFIEEANPQMPWTLFLGGGWAIDTQERPPVEVIKNVEKIVNVAKSQTKIAGFVHEKLGADGKGGTGPVANAQILWANHPELNALLGGADGRFLTQDLDPGEYAFAIRAEGYKPGECAVTVVKDAPVAQLDCAVEALPRLGVLVVKARDEAGAGLSGAMVKVTVAGKDFQMQTDGQGVARFVDIAPGTVSAFADADGYLTAVQNGEVKARQDNPLDIAMHKKPKNSLVNIGKTEITIRQQVQFELNSAKIMSQSDMLLEEIADALLKTPRLKRIEIQGHTDNSGTPDRNNTLSDERASSVRAWLVGHGVSPDRLVAKGYGQSRPLVPNVTTANKARNRRVQFVILEQEAASGEAPKAPTPRPAATTAPKPAGGSPKKPDMTPF